jgi:hypothetical protein
MRTRASAVAAARLLDRTPLEADAENAPAHDPLPISEWRSASDQLEGQASDEHDDLTLELLRAFLRIRDPRHRRAICLLARALIDDAAE